MKSWLKKFLLKTVRDKKIKLQVFFIIFIANTFGAFNICSGCYKLCQHPALKSGHMNCFGKNMGL